MNSCFNPFEEMKAGRYQFSEKLGFGRFVNCYYESMDDGNLFCLYFCSDPIARIIDRLPAGCFVPLDNHINAWHTEYYGKDWKANPKAFFQAYSAVLAFCDKYCKRFGAISTGREYRDLTGRKNYTVFSKSRDNKIHNDLTSPHGKLVPIYFDRSFYEANMA